MYPFDELFSNFKTLKYQFFGIMLPMVVTLKMVSNEFTGSKMCVIFAVVGNQAVSSC